MVGSEQFEIGSSRTKCEVRIDTCSGLNYEYFLTVNGKNLQRFKEKQKKNLKSWSLEKGGQKYRIVLGERFAETQLNREATFECFHFFQIENR